MTNWMAARQSLFGIVQGGMYRDLRRECAERLVEMDFDGYAIGGLSVGEPRDLTLEMIAEVLPLLPADKPRYVMGVGYPDEIEQYARMGVDMMDCVLPTRAARHGLLFTSEGRLNIKGQEVRRRPEPARSRLRVHGLPPLLARLSAPPDAGRRTARGHAEHHPQPGLLPGHHAAGAAEPPARKTEDSCLRVHGPAEQLLQRLHVFGERPAAGFGHAVEGLRLALHKLLLDRHIAGFFQLQQLRAQVAVRRAGLRAQPGKLRLLDPRSSESSARRSFP